MDADEVLRLAQITGLAEMFADKDFNEAWECDLEEEELINEDEQNISSILVMGGLFAQDV